MKISVVRQGPVRRLLLASSFAKFGLGMQFIVETWVVLDLGGDISAVAAVMVYSGLPGLIFGPYFGSLIDRVDRRLIAAWMDMARSLILLIFAIFFLLGHGSIFSLYILAFLMATAAAVHEPAISALVAEEVEPQYVLDANAAIGVANQVGLLTGAAAGGVLVTISTSSALLGANSLCLLAAGFMTLKIRDRTVVAADKDRRSAWIDIREGASYLLESRALLAILACYVVLMSTLRTINLLLAPFCKDVLQGNAAILALVDGAFAAGALAGGFLVPYFARRTSMKLALWLLMFAVSASLFWFGAVGNYILAACAYFVLGLSFQVRAVWHTACQLMTRGDMQGRVFSVFNMGVSCLAIAVPIAVSKLSGLVPVRSLYGIQAAVVAIAGVVAILLPSSIFRKAKG